eukprot:4918088-Pyramimonas_sp.AAC.1
MDFQQRRRRRREGAIAASLVVGWRLRRAGWSFGAILKDMSNAFGGSSWEALDHVISTIVQPEHVAL